MKKTRKLRIVCAALAVFVTVAALLPGISGTDALAVSQSQIDALEEQRDALAPAQARQLAELLNGAAAVGKEEERLAEQVALNGRLLKQIVELDRILNQKLGGEKSLYHKKLDTGPSG